MSSLGWIDFSSEHRDRVRTVIDLLSVPGVLDELGIGVIRDAFADRMFPGISTIQTRAKYFILTALLIRDFMDRGGRRETLDNFLRIQERECRIRLVERHGENRRSLGIIGSTFKTSRKRDVIRGHPVAQLQPDRRDPPAFVDLLGRIAAVRDNTPSWPFPGRVRPLGVRFPPTTQLHA